MPVQCDSRVTGVRVSLQRGQESAVVCRHPGARTSCCVNLQPAAAGLSQTTKVNSCQLNISSPVGLICTEQGDALADSYLRGTSFEFKTEHQGF